MRNFTKIIFSVILFLIVVAGVKAQAPTITSFSPTTAGAGTSVTITGTNFTYVYGVSFGGKAAANYFIISPTTIIAIVSTGNSGSVFLSGTKGAASMGGFSFCGSAGNASVAISTNSNNLLYGSSVSFTASAINGGTNSNYLFNVNTIPVQSSTSNIFTSTSLQNGDVVNCVLTSDASCLANNIASSSNEIVRVTGSNPSQWNDVGNQPFENSEGIKLALGNDNTPYAYYMDTLHQRRGTVKSFTNNTWVNLGDSASLPNYAEIAVSPTGILYLAGFVDTSTRVSVKRFVNGTWESVGGFATPFNASSVKISFASNGTPYIGFKVYDNVKGFLASVTRFNGTNWFYVGGTTAYTGAVYEWFDFKVSPQDVPYLVFGDFTQVNYAATCLKFNGTSWEVVGSKGFTTARLYLSIAFKSDGTPFVCGSGSTNQVPSIYRRAVVYTFDGTAWSSVGGQFVSTDTLTNSFLTISKLGNPIVIYQKIPTDNDLTQFYICAKKFENNSWGQVGGNICGVSRSEGLKYLSILPASNDSYFATYSHKAIGTSFVKQYGTVILPTKLLTFAAQQQNNTVNLNWQTTNEVNTSHFIIQRSVDGTSFSNIGKVAAKGDGGYTFADNQLPSASIVYYRLQMVDKDGSFTYSKIVGCQLSVVSKALAIYPNPVRDNLFVQVISTKAEKITLQVTDLQGKLLQQEDTQVSVGNVSLSVNISALAKGTYVLLVKGSGGVQQKQFVKE